MIYLALLIVLSVVCNYPVYRMIASDVRRFEPTRHPAPNIAFDVPYLPSYNPRGLI